MLNKKVHHEEHMDETWLIPYADMLTLLLALFIVMFAISQTDKAKFQQISEQFNIIFSGGSGIQEREGNSLIPMIKTGGMNSPTAIEDDKMNEIKKMLEEEIKREGHSNEINLMLNQEGLEISIQDTMLFASGNATIMDNESQVLYSVGRALRGIDNNIKIIGHTDNVPINNRQFRSNWDLSAMRAINVMQFLVSQGDLLPNRFVVQGNGEFSPKFDNSTEAGRAKNRRVEIFIIRKYPLDEEAATAGNSGAEEAL